jgi:hypothetical protein
MRVYLSGGMEFADQQGAGWRDEIERWLAETLGHTSFNPVTESRKFLERRYAGSTVPELKETDYYEYRRFLDDIVEIDSNEVAQHADYVICYWDESARRGAGTKGEITLARYFGKPVYLVTDEPAKNLPGWVVGCTTEIFQSFKELKSYLRNQYNGYKTR